MSRKIKIVTSSFGTFEAFAPPFNLREPDSSENIKLAQSILESAASFNPDIVLLPETFKTAGMGSDKISSEAEEITGETVQMLKSQAKKGNFNLIAGLVIREGSKLFNKALIISRQGELVGTYSKNFPTEGEISGGISPSNIHSIFHLDCAKIGVGICFDINWPDIWEKYNRDGAELFCWISAYEGGFSIRKTAINYRTPFVSSVMPYFGRIIEINGEDITSTSRWNRLAYCEINLDRELFHTDLQMDKIAEIQKKYGDKVCVKVFHEEHLFLVENNMDNKNISDIIREFDLIPFNKYIDRCTQFRAAHL